MRKYTNRDGDTVNVSKEHLDTAVEIKIELQKLSPSRRCNWNRHMRMMEESGFHDSDKNESYRCLIKDYQKSIGELPEVAKHANMLADSKIEAIKSEVGNLAYRTRDAQNTFRSLNKLKRDVIDFTLIAEQIGESFRNHDFSKLNLKYKELQKTDKKMVVCISDIHIGALVDSKFNKYNYKIAQERMEKYLSKIIYEIERNEISEVYIMNLGDSIENPYMHNLSYTSEFTLSEQIVMASDIIIKFMVMVSEYANVKIAGIAGNHDRLNGDKNKSLDGDHAVRGINKAILSFIENSKSERIEYVQAEDYRHSFNINGVNIMAVHGDLDNKNDDNILSKHSTIDNRNYDVVIMGHYHTREFREVTGDKFIIVSGSLKGSDDYSVNKLRKSSSPSQTYLIIDEDGEMEIKWVTMKYVESITV